MEADYIVFIFFIWILCSSLIRFIGSAYMSKSIKVYEGFHYWTLSSFLNIVSMVLFVLSFSGIGLFLFLGFCTSLASMLLLPYGLKVFGAIKTGKFFPLFVISTLLLAVILMSTIQLPFRQSFSITVYATFIPILILCVLFIGKKGSAFDGLRKRMLTITMILAIILSVSRILFSIYDTTIEAMGTTVYLKQWATILLDNTFTLIYLAFILMNFRRVENELEESQEELDILEGLLPICSKCKQIRDDDGKWNKLEGYISSHSEVKFSHSICPTCVDELYPHLKDKLREKRENSG